MGKVKRLGVGFDTAGRLNSMLHGAKVVAVPLMGPLLAGSGIHAGPNLLQHPFEEFHCSGMLSVFRGRYYALSAVESLKTINYFRRMYKKGTRIFSLAILTGINAAL